MDEDVRQLYISLGTCSQDLFKLQKETHDISTTIITMRKYDVIKSEIERLENILEEKISEMEDLNIQIEKIKKKIDEIQSRCKHVFNKVLTKRDAELYKCDKCGLYVDRL